MDTDLFKGNIPHDLAQAVDRFILTLEPSEHAALKNSADGTHFGAGTFLRNNWSLWDRDAPLAKWFRDCLGIGHADDMSAIILESAHRKLNGQKIGAIKQAEYFKRLWREQGLDPVTQQPLSDDKSIGDCTLQHVGFKPPPAPCLRPPDGWHCTRAAGHDGPCAAHPIETGIAGGLLGWWRRRRRLRQTKTLLASMGVRWSPTLDCTITVNNHLRLRPVTLDGGFTVEPLPLPSVTVQVFHA